MTLLATIHLGDVAIIASDKKEVIKSGEVIIPCHEKAKKIIDSGIGLMTGSGFVELLDKVKSRVKKTEIDNTDTITNIITQEREAIENDMSLHDKLKNEVLSTTGWLFSYCTVIDNQPCLRIALYHPSIHEENLSIIEENSGKAIFPSDLECAKVTFYTEMLKEGIVTFEQEFDFKRNILSNVNLILSLMDEVSKLSETVSSSCDIGLVFSNGKYLVANNVNINTDDIKFNEIRS